MSIGTIQLVILFLMGWPRSGVLHYATHLKEIA